MNLGVYRCPVCSGPIARWGVRKAFTCHHCHWALASNLERVLRLAAWAAVAVEVLLFAGLWWWQGDVWAATGTYLAVACLAGVAAWFLVMDLALRLVPLHPPPGR